MSDLKIRPLKAPYMQRRRAGHPANPRTQTEVCVTKPKTSTSQGGPYKTWPRRKSGRVERGGECTYNRATPALLRGITGTHEGKAMDE